LLSPMAFPSPPSFHSWRSLFGTEDIFGLGFPRHSSPPPHFVVFSWERGFCLRHTEPFQPTSTFALPFPHSKLNPPRESIPDGLLLNSPLGTTLSAGQSESIWRPLCASARLDSRCEQPLPPSVFSSPCRSSFFLATALPGYCQ